jgi:ribonuclease HII
LVVLLNGGQLSVDLFEPNANLAVVEAWSPNAQAADAELHEVSMASICAKHGLYLRNKDAQDVRWPVSSCTVL